MKTKKESSKPLKLIRTFPPVKDARRSIRKKDYRMATVDIFFSVFFLTVGLGLIVSLGYGIYSLVSSIVTDLVFREFLTWTGIALGIAAVLAVLGYFIFFKDVDEIP